MVAQEVKHHLPHQAVPEDGNDNTVFSIDIIQGSFVDFFGLLEGGHFFPVDVGYGAWGDDVGQLRIPLDVLVTNWDSAIVTDNNSSELEIFTIP